MKSSVFLGNCALLGTAVFLNACGGSSGSSGNAPASNTQANQEHVLYSFSNTGATGYTVLPNLIFPSLPPSSATAIIGHDGNFYGVNYTGGANNDGTVYSVTPSGVATAMYAFSGGTGDGMNPSSLIQGSDGNFYGVTYFGGTYGAGTLFRLTPAGTETVIYNFGSSATDAAYPGLLIQGKDGNFYGLSFGGAYLVPTCFVTTMGCGYGTVFKVTPSGTESVVYSFGATPSDGAYPSALIQGTDGNLYGLALINNLENAEIAGGGILFTIKPDGTFTSLHAFNGLTEGAYPTSLAEGADGNFYGITSSGGTPSEPFCNSLDSYCGSGTFFKATPAGAITILYAFNSTAVLPWGPKSLIAGNDGNFYGLVEGGYVKPGVTANGAVIQLTSAGHYSGIDDFGANSTDTTSPLSLVQAGNGIFYGTGMLGGANGVGTVFTVTP